MKELSNLINTLYDVSFGQSHKMVRASCLINLLLHIQFEMGYQTSQKMIEKLNFCARKFKEDGKVLEVKIMHPILKEQIARYSIMRRKQFPRKFVYLNIVAATNYVSEKSVNMEGHGMACYIIASKYYSEMNLNSWNLILEFVFYNLGGLYLGQKQYSNALYYLINALNNSKMFDGESSQIPAKTFRKVIKMIDQAKNAKDVTESEKVGEFIRQNLRTLKFKDFDVITQDELVLNLSEIKGRKKDKKASSTLIGNSYSCKFSEIILG